VESNELSELLLSSWKTNPEERLTMDDLVPKLQYICKQMRMSYEEDEKKNFGSKSFNSMVTRHQKKTILTAVCFGASVKTVQYLWRKESEREITMP